jgi:5-(carboxyamino)imidazole ribonucleotide synthase
MSAGWFDCRPGECHSPIAVSLGSVHDVSTPPAEQRHFDVGIAGAGQLARMTCLAAWPLGIRVAVLGAPNEPAGLVAAGVVPGDWKDPGAVRELGTVSTVVTLENEFVDAAVLAEVAASGTPVYPLPESLAVIQDKALQKALLRSYGLPVPPHAVVDHPSEFAAVGRDFGWPLVLKARKLGYDGYGNATCRTPEEAEDAFGRLNAGEGVLVEAFVPFVCELATMVARSTRGDEAVYPVCETVQRDHVCHEVVVPARIDDGLREEAKRVARAAATAAEGLGVTGVEMFLLEDGRVLVNELAPRPHNSGHYSIEACETSQFENHLRGILGLPLGPPLLRAPSAAMVNILGTVTGPSQPGLAAALSVRGAHLHLYDKAEVRVRRKMGHVTALAGTADEALAIARSAAQRVGL